MASSLGILSYFGAAIAFLAVLALTLPSYPGTRQAGALVGAIAATAAWGIVLAGALYVHDGFAAWMLIPDALHGGAWILFVAWFLNAHSPARRLAAMLAAGAVLLMAAVGMNVARAGFGGDGAGQSLAVTMLGLPLLGLLGIEQLFRNSVFEQRRVLKPLCVGIGIVFSMDVFVFSQALLFAQVNEALWMMRGFVVVAAAPLLILAVKRQPGWGQDVFVSRHVVFYTTSLVAAGLYLLAMAAGGFLIAALGIAWGPLLQLVFFACAGAALLYALFSLNLRRRIKVFIAKHFYRNRYDYREEWLRLIQTLSGSEEEVPLVERSIRALADIIGAEHGRLWMVARGGGRFEPSGTWRMTSAGSALAADDVLVRFMQATHWLVDTEEYRAQPEKYSNALEAGRHHLEDPALFVPLVHDKALIGIVGLGRPSGLGQLSYEDHDLLKTAGQQVAIFLQQDRAREELSETRQFEAFSRLTAFLMHDLKNLIAQQELVIRNAQRFKHRPEFIEDTIRTIESGVQRMRKVLDRLQSAARQEHRSVVDVGAAVLEACKTCSDRTPLPSVQTDAVSARVAADREKLCMAVTHAIRNAQDATPADGDVTIRVTSEDGIVRIEVTDTGCGMDPDFVRTELFKPFHSTKGAKGMGIGAYQIRETIRAAGGEVEVRSAPGAGTTLSMSLPAVEVQTVGQSAA